MKKSRAITTTFKQPDYDRLIDAATREGTSPSAWMRKATRDALDKMPSEFAVCFCNHATIEHNKSGCTMCRCPKFKEKQCSRRQ